MFHFGRNTRRGERPPGSAGSNSTTATAPAMSRVTHPEATVYRLPDTVMGTAVISTQYLTTEGDIFEVIPRMTPTYLRVSTSRVTDDKNESVFANDGLGTIVSRSITSVSLTAVPTDSGVSEDRNGGKPLVYEAQPLIRTPTSGYILFTDEFLDSYPSSYVAAISRQYGVKRIQPGTPGVPARSVHSYIDEAELEQRPLFCLRSSDVIYGTAEYVPRGALSESHNGQEAHVPQ